MSPVVRGGLPATNAEAARYGVLRRLVPALKHDMVVDLQAVSMMAEVLNARLEKGSPNQAELQKSISKINRLARDAVATCLAVTAWIDPVADEGVALHDGVENCVMLLLSSFNFHGFSISNQVLQDEFEVDKGTLRNLLAAALIVLTDNAPGPCDIVISAEIEPGFASLVVQCLPRAGDGETPVRDAGYRQLEWTDIQALALAESVEILCRHDRIAMRLPRLVATTPLQIAPL